MPSCILLSPLKKWNVASVINLQNTQPEEPLRNKYKTGFLLLRRLAIGKHQTLLLQQKRAQAANPLLAPLTFSTPLCKVRYQKMAAFAERCCFSCRKTASFNTRKANSKKSSVFVKKTSAFLEKIRGPPSEIWHHNQIYKRRSAKWQIGKSTWSKWEVNW